MFIVFEQFFDLIAVSEQFLVTMGHTVDPIRNVATSRYHFLGHTVDPIRNVTTSCWHVLGHKIDPIRNVTTSHFGFWAIG